MKYTYHVNPQGSDTTGRPSRRPMVGVEVRHQRESRKFLALIDSGADSVIIGSWVADILGIPLNESRAIYVKGVGGHIQTGYIIDLSLTVEHFHDAVTVPAVVLETDVPVLLGQEGFFDLHRIKFERDHDVFEITPVRK